MNTFQQVSSHLINTYPSLYSASSLQEARFKVMDHVFNVIGTGIEHTLFEELTKDEINPNYINGSILYYEDPYARDIKVLTKKEALQKGLNLKKLVVANRSYIDKEKNTFECGSDRVYPNFKKEYSLIWKDVFEHRETEFNDKTEEWDVIKTHKGLITELSEDWYDASLEFYGQCKTFFSNEYTCRNYCNGINQYDEDEKNDAIADMTNMLKDYETDEEISEAYGIEFDGDIEDFLKRRWNKERSRILSFIDETLNRIEHLKEQKLK